MEIYTIIGTIFLELFVSVLASMAFLLFLREYGRNKHPAMAWFAAASAAQFCTHILHFFAQFSASRGAEQLAVAMLSAAMFIIVVHSLLVVRGVFLLRKMGVALKYSLLLVCVASGTYAFYHAFVHPPMLQFVHGIPFLANGDPLRGAVAFAMFASLASIAALAVNGKREALASGSDVRYPSVLAVAVVAGVIIRVMAFLTDSLAIEELVFVSLFVYPVYVVALYIGVLACADADPVVRKAPFAVIRRDLLTKSIVTVAVAMLFMSLVIHTTVSVLYVKDSEVTKTDDLSHQVESYGGAYQGAAARLVEETARFANDPGVTAALTVPGSSMQDRLYASASEFIWRKSNMRGIAIVDAQGATIFSSKEEEKGGSYPEASAIMVRAFSGNRAVGIESDAEGEWVIRAAVPVEIDGVVAHVAVMEEMLETVFSAAVKGHRARTDGVGLVLDDGTVAYEKGFVIDKLFVKTLRETAVGKEEFIIPNGQGDCVLVQRLVAADGTMIGHIYAIKKEQTVLVGVFRSVAFVSFLVLTGTMLTLLIIYLMLARVMRPIRMLRDAAEHVEKERYDVRIDYEGVDELGQLAASFNRMQDTIARRTGELKTALREQQDFVGHTARELRNPVNIFRWTLELMRYGDTGRLNKEQLELLEQLHQTNERLFKVVQNLQDAVRIDQGKFALKFRAVVIEDVIDEVAGMVAVRARGKGVTFHWNRPTKPLPVVRADAEHLLKIAHNLVSNAVKYTLKGGHVEVDVEMADESSPGGRKGSFVRITIEDNGIGIPQSEQSRIFERFYRAKNAIEGEIQGTGLGLFIAKHVIERHGGAIWFRSREEVGTTFTFTLPIDDVAEHRTKKS